MESGIILKPIYREDQGITCFYCSWKFQMTVCLSPLVSLEESALKTSVEISLL